MSGSKLIELSYYDPSAQVRLSAYADTIVLDRNEKGSVICAIRFGGYPEMVRAMADAIYGGATIEATQNDTVRLLQSSLKGYRRQLTHDGVYAVATLMASDDAQEESRRQDDGEERTLERSEQPRKCYIFCPEGDRTCLFEELDHKTAAPLIPAFRDYVLASLQSRGDLRQLEVISQKERIDAWVLELAVEERNVPLIVNVRTRKSKYILLPKLWKNSNYTGTPRFGKLTLYFGSGIKSDEGWLQELHLYSAAHF